MSHVQTKLAHSEGVYVEGELGKLAGKEVNMSHLHVVILSHGVTYRAKDTIKGVCFVMFSVCYVK